MVTYDDAFMKAIRWANADSLYESHRRSARAVA